MTEEGRHFLPIAIETEVASKEAGEPVDEAFQEGFVELEEPTHRGHCLLAVRVG